MMELDLGVRRVYISKKSKRRGLVPYDFGSKPDEILIKTIIEPITDKNIFGSWGLSKEDRYILRCACTTFNRDFYKSNREEQMIIVGDVASRLSQLELFDCLHLIPSEIK